MTACVRAGLIMATLLPLGACSVATPPRVALAQPVAMAPANVSFDPVPEGPVQSQLAREFADDVKLELAARGVGVLPDGASRLTLAIVQRPAAIGVAAARAPDAAGWISQPRKHRMFDACQAQRIEATLVLAGPDKVAQVRGAFDDCTAPPGQVRELARSLVAALLAR